MRLTDARSVCWCALRPWWRKLPPPCPGHAKRSMLSRPCPPPPQVDNEVARAKADGSQRAVNQAREAIAGWLDVECSVRYSPHAASASHLRSGTQTWDTS